MSAVDIALWDLAGKLLGQPIYRLLGGPFRASVPVYASGIPGRTGADRAAAANQLIEDGYTTLKASIVRGTLDANLAAIANLSEAIGGGRASPGEVPPAQWAGQALRRGPTPPDSAQLGRAGVAPPLGA